MTRSPKPRKPPRRYFWASYWITDGIGHQSFIDTVFADLHPFELAADNWPGHIWTLISFVEISRMDYMRHGEHT